MGVRAMHRTGDNAREEPSVSIRMIWVPIRQGHCLLGRVSGRAIVTLRPWGQALAWRAVGMDPVLGDNESPERPGGVGGGALNAVVVAGAGLVLDDHVSREWLAQ